MGVRTHACPVSWRVGVSLIRRSPSSFSQSQGKSWGFKRMNDDACMTIRTAQGIRAWRDLRNRKKKHYGQPAIWWKVEKRLGKAIGSLVLSQFSTSGCLLPISNINALNAYTGVTEKSLAFWNHFKRCPKVCSKMFEAPKKNDDTFCSIVLDVFLSDFKALVIPIAPIKTEIKSNRIE